MKDEALKLAKSWFEANTYGDEAVEVYEAIEQALAAQPAVQEPQRYSPDGEGGMEVDSLGAYVKLQDVTTPPAAPIPDAIHHTDLSEHSQYIEGWNDCRAEMLKGMKP
jgi:hypothetical protein